MEHPRMISFAVIVNGGGFDDTGHLFLAIEVYMLGKLAVLKDMDIAIGVPCDPSPRIFSWWNLFDVVGSFFASVVCNSAHRFINVQFGGTKSSILKPSANKAGPNQGLGAYTFALLRYAAHHPKLLFDITMFLQKLIKYISM